MDTLFNIWLTGSVIGFALFIYMLIIMSEKNGEDPRYNEYKMLADLVLVVLASWISILFLWVTIASIKEKTSPRPIMNATLYIVSIFAAFIKGKEYN